MNLQRIKKEELINMYNNKQITCDFYIRKSSNLENEIEVIKKSIVIKNIIIAISLFINVIAVIFFFLK